MKAVVLVVVALLALSATASALRRRGESGALQGDALAGAKKLASAAKKLGKQYGNFRFTYVVHFFHVSG